jgi:dTDP-glucose 4,6-dehydratase
LARKILNWEPKYTRSAGLKPTLDYFKKKVLG